MARRVSRQEAVEGLVAILTTAQEEEPRLVPFIRSLWTLCQDKRSLWTLDRMPVHTDEWRRLKGGRSTYAGRKAYLVYREWMQQHRYKRQPLLEQVEQGGTAVRVDPQTGERTTKRIVGTWRVNLPFCDGDPWDAVLARLPRPTTAPGLGMRHIAAIRECVAAPWMQSLRCHHAVQVRQIVETAKMGAYRALLSSGRGKVTVCPIWPDRKGADLAVWNMASGSRRAREKPPDLLIVVGKADGHFAEVSRRFDRANAGGKAARVYLAIREPAFHFQRQASLNGIRIIRVAGIAESGLGFKVPRVQE